jgi:hypothetical protein
VKENRAFIDNLLEFLYATTPLARARWEKKHPLPGYFAGSLEYAMFAPWRNFNSLKIPHILRSYIDEWIDTGFRPDGSEMPYSRNFIPRQRKDGESIPDYHKNAHINAPNAIQALARLHQAELIVAMDPGKAVYIYQIQDARLVARLHPEGGIEYIPEPTLANPDAGKCAAQIFLEFFSTEWRYRLMRCRQCRSLCAPKNKPRNGYPRGWYCNNCRNSAAAQAATEKTRDLLWERWFMRAVNAYREFEDQPGRTGRDRIQFITDRVNAGLPALHRIKRNTITLNLEKIQATAEGRRNVTRKSKRS